MMNFQGYADGKPSSRVLNPPGGRSNNIFGCDEPVKQEAPKVNARSDSNIFNNEPEVSKPRTNNQNGRSESNVFNNEVEAPRTRANAPNAQHARTGYNTITGEAYQTVQKEVKVAEEIKPVPQETKEPESETIPEHVKASQDARHNLHTSSRVLKPPGGGGQTRLW